jgi:hypothetical protein
LTFLPVLLKVPRLQSWQSNLSSLYAYLFHLIFLFRGKPNVPIILTGHKKTPVGAIVGGVIGGVALFLTVAGAIFFWRRSRVKKQPKVVIDPRYEEEQAKPHPFDIQRAPINNDSASQLQKRSSNANLMPSNRESLEPRSESRHSGGSYLDGRGDTHLPVATTLPVQSSKQSYNEREASQQNQSAQNPSESAESASTNARSAMRSERGQTWRVEVEELRREMEAIRNMAQPPPSYE